MADLTPLVNTLEALRAARAEIEKWKAVQESCEEVIKDVLGDAESGEIDGHVVVTWRSSRPAVTLDVKRLQEELPAEVLAPYMIEKKAARPFKVVE